MKGQAVRRIATLSAIAIISLGQLQAQGPGASTAPERKVTTRFAPAYPDLAKRMHIQGTVKVEAIVRPNGTVKSTRVLGGSPVLVEAASDAVRNWKFQPSQNETTEVVQLVFEDH
jgi:TonB family protein